MNDPANTRRLRLLYFMPYGRGGLAEYAVAQIRAIAEFGGAEVAMLAPSDLEVPAQVRRIPIDSPRFDRRAVGSSKLVRAGHFLRQCLSEQTQLDRAIHREQPNAVLIGAFSEYFAPLWAWRFRRRRRSGVRFGAIVHDPVRDYVRGPLWWHRRSIAEAYSYLDLAFVHESIVLDTAGELWNFRTVPVRHGLFETNGRRVSRIQARSMLDIPAEAKVFLSFGHIRDGKNLHLFIESMPHFPGVYLLVAGSEQSAGQKPATFYQELARRTGVADRIRWFTQYIPATEAPRFFSAADYLLLTYSNQFRSASGVLATAAGYQLPCLASSGDGPLKSSVEAYKLGVFVKPDSRAALQNGIDQLLRDGLAPNWVGFCADHSWERNAEDIVSSFASLISA